MKIETLIDQAAKLNIKYNELKKQLDEKKTAIKEYCLENGLSTAIGKAFQIKITNRVTHEFNQDKGVAIAKNIQADWLLKEVIDLDKLEEAIRIGEIDAKYFADCWTTKTSKAISFKEVK